MDLTVGEAMKIYVKPARGKAIPVKVDSNDSIGDIKQKIDEKEGIPTKKEELLFDGQVLDNDKCLADYGIPNGSTLDLATAPGSSMKIFAKTTKRKTC